MTLGMKIMILYEKIITKKLIFITLVLSLSLFIAFHQSLLLINVEQLEALLVYSSFVRVATGGFRIIPFSLVVAVVCAQMRSESGITLYLPQH